MRNPAYSSGDMGKDSLGKEKCTRQTGQEGCRCRRDCAYVTGSTLKTAIFHAHAHGGAKPDAEYTYIHACL